MSGFLWKFLDLPRIPDHLISQYKTVTSVSDLETTGRLVVAHTNPYRKDPKIPSVLYKRFAVNPDLEHWLKENIVADATDYGISCAYAHEDRYPVEFLPHIDDRRQYTLMYNLDTGGDNVATRFYISDDGMLEYPFGSQTNSLSGIREISNVVIPLERWCVVNARIIHGAGTLIKPRISLQLGLMEGDKYTT